MANVLITGATDGIGLLLAKAYAGAGHKVLATGRKLIASESEYFGQSGITYIHADQAHPASAARMVTQTLEQLNWQQLDLAILNAAIGWSGAPEDESPEMIVSQVTVNLTGTIAIAHCLAQPILRAHGKLVLIGSTAAKGHAQFGTYAATKAGISGFARSLREEWRDRASVQVIHPGPTRTSMHAKAGVKIGAAGMLFMSPTAASRAILCAVQGTAHERKITKAYAFLSRFLGKKVGQL